MIGSKASTDAEVFADALEGRGPRNSEVRELVRFAETLCESAVDASPDFVMSLRQQLMTEAATVLVKTPVAVRERSEVLTTHPVRRRLAAATAALIAMSGMVGIVASSAQAIPGDMLYPVKRGVENVELTMHRSDASRGSFQLAQASERLAEAHSLATQRDPRSQAAVVKTLAEFSDTATAGSAALFDDYSSGGNEKSIDEVSTFASTSSSVLESISAKLPASSTDAFTVAATTVTDLVSQATTLCAACNVASLPSNLASTVAKVLTPKSTAKTDPAAGATQPSTVAPSASPTNIVSGLVGTVTNPPKSQPTTSPTAPTTSPPKLSTVTDPLLGALLGDETQPGLVPGLLNGLLGGGTK